MLEAGASRLGASASVRIVKELNSLLAATAATLPVRAI
jgi:deoxyribose-phosphate aldolase